MSNNTLPIPPSSIDIKWAIENFSSRVLPPNAQNLPNIVPDNNGTPGDPDDPSSYRPYRVSEHGLVAADNTDRVTGFLTLIANSGIHRFQIGTTVIYVNALSDLSTKPVIVDTTEGTVTLSGFTVRNSAPSGAVFIGDLHFTYVLKNSINNQGGTTSALDEITSEEYSDKIRCTLYDMKYKQKSYILVTKIADDI